MTAGSGSAVQLVCLHGFTGGGGSWDQVSRLVSPDWAVHALELHGHGAAQDTSTSFEAEADRLVRLLGPRPSAGNRESQVVLVGYSLGARVALSVLRRHPTRFDRAVLIGVHPGLVDGHEQRRTADRSWIELLERDGIEAFARAWQALPLFASQQRCGVEVLRAQATVRRQQEALRLASSLRYFGLAEMPDGSDLLLRPPIPVTLVVGEEDAKFLGLAKQVVASSDPEATLELVVVPECGHNVPLEQPAALVRLMESRLGKREVELHSTEATL